MPILSYNEDTSRTTKLRHIFLPNTYGLVSEAIIAGVALVIFNLSNLNDQLLNKDTGTLTNPLSEWSHLLNTILSNLQQRPGVQQFLLFALWAFVGALFYILAFRFVQIFIVTKGTVNQGVHLIQAEHSRGAARWFASLHDFFVRILIIVAGAVALAIGILVCFSIASQELTYGLTNPFPSNLLPLALSFVAAFLSVRIVVIGISLLSQRFRIWYNS